MKKLWSIGLVLGLGITFIAGCGKDEVYTKEDPLVIKVSNTDTAQRSTNKAMEWLAAYMAEKTGGRVRVEIYPDGQLGDDPQLCAGILEGKSHIYFGLGGVLGGIVGPELDLLDLPFLYQSYEAWEEGSFEKGGLAIYNELLTDSGYTCVDFMYNGMLNLCSSKKVYHNAADMAGFKVRVVPTENNVKVFEALGAQPMPLPWGEVYPAVAQGQIDGLSHSLGVFNDFKFYELAPFITISEHQSSPYTVVMSTEFLASLPEDIHAHLLEGLHQACARQRQQERELERDYIATFNQNGATVYRCTQEEKEAFFQGCEDVYAAQRELTGADAFDRFVATAR